MAGTKAGAQKALATLEATGRGNRSAWRKGVSAKGGRAPKTRPSGWAYMAVNDPQRLRELSSKGGTLSKQGKPHES